MTRGVGVVVEGACLFVVLIGRLGRRGTGFVVVLNEFLAAAEDEFGPPAVQCEVLGTKADSYFFYVIVSETNNTRRAPHVERGARGNWVFASSPLLCRPWRHLRLSKVSSATPG